MHVWKGGCSMSRSNYVDKVFFVCVCLTGRERAGATVRKSSRCRPYCEGIGVGCSFSCTIPLVTTERYIIGRPCTSTNTFTLCVKSSQKSLRARPASTCILSTNELRNHHYPPYLSSHPSSAMFASSGDIRPLNRGGNKIHIIVQTTF